VSTLSQFIGGGNIKSVQRGTITMGTSGSVAATITAVDTAKSVLIHLGSQSPDNDFSRGMTRVQLTNSTTVTALTSGNSGSGATVGWQVVEYE
jgi:hypothetical protein